MERHPRLHAKIHEFTTLLFDAARVGLEAYDAWKKRRRVVDFVDMIDRALSLTSEPAVAAELRTRLKFLVVDEFQDTSPVQLALLARLHHLAGRSTGMGDRWQCIPGLSRSQRLARAERLHAAEDLRALLEPESLLRARDQQRAWADGRWPSALWRREVAVTVSWRQRMARSVGVRVISPSQAFAPPPNHGPLCER